MTTPATMRPPLTGLTILDLADEPVALAARLLGDLGATVIRVESANGDSLRQAGPFVHGEPGIERSLPHFVYNAGKQSLALDLDSPRAWEIIGTMAARADVVIAPVRRIGPARDFFAPSNFERVAPGIGLVQPLFRRDREEEFTDLIGIAAGGQLSLNGYAEDPPNHPAGNLAYKQLALASALAAMSLVFESAAGRPTGRIEVSMQEAVMWTTIQSANENYWHWHQLSPARRGIDNVGGQTIFPSRDGKYLSLYHHPPAFAAFARWYGEVFGDDTYTRAPWDDGYYRFEQAVRITEITAQFCASMDREALITEAQKRGILAVPVQSVGDIAADPHLRARGFFQPVRVDQLDAELELLRAPFVSSLFTSVAKAPPALGEHSVAVLRTAGFSDETVAALLAEGVVHACAPAPAVAP
ncbi:MAG: CoA transferase [Dehalococcoidia bacterium]